MKITDAQLKQIYAHAQESYPAEGCGFLLGASGYTGLVRQVRRAVNQTNRPDRFIISGEALAEAHFAAEAVGLEIIGLYHSHPDWPALPSQTDLNHTWAEAYTLIVSVHQGKPLHTTVWQLAADSPRRFTGVALEIVDENELKNGN